MAKARLIIVHRGRRRELALEPGEYYVGRLRKADAEALGIPYDSTGVYIYSPEKRFYVKIGESSVVSRRHLLLRVDEEGRVYIIDHGKEGTGSTYGTYLNKERVEPGVLVELQPGDVVSLTEDETGVVIVYPGAPGEAPIDTTARLREVVVEAREALLRGEHGHAKRLLSRLAAEKTRRLIVETGDRELQLVYEQLVDLYKSHDPQAVKNQLVSLLDRLQGLLEAQHD